MTASASADRINYLNIGLMLGSALVALFVPFELFLFAYTILGPGHYLTEISWLHKRQFFTKGRYDYWLLAGLAVLLFIESPIVSQGFSREAHFASSATFTFLAFGSALVLMLAAKWRTRALGLAAVAVLSFIPANSGVFLVALLALFVPTLIHVYVFTGFFMIYGALRERSRTGHLSFAIFLLCPLACLFLDPVRWTPSAYVIDTYWNNFAVINRGLLGLGEPRSAADLSSTVLAVFKSDRGLAFMRFIAFAYMYHYLNWFSKTSIIGWHKVSRGRLAAIGSLWAASVGLYFYDYSVGLKALFCLSFLHLYLEFPLNHLSIIGTFKEVRSMMGAGTEPVAAAAMAGKNR